MDYVKRPDTHAGRKDLVSERTGLIRLLARGALKRCARCGEHKLFRRWLTMVPACPRCGLRFEREEGAWLGGVVINMGATQTFVIILLVAGLVLTWPDVPLVKLLIVDAVLITAFSMWFLPFSKTLWVAIDLWLRSGDAEDRADIDRAH